MLVHFHYAVPKFKGMGGGFSLHSKCKREGEGGGGGRKMEEGDWGGAKEREHLQPKPANSIFLCSKSGCKMLIGRDMSRESVNYSLAVRLASAYFNMITIAF